ncbi:TetR/AcrR family transcriptional regulator [Mucilaginibacter sp. KACC 22773]|uniref:TetR/AcrR family transcriptional regulator n=1 Tax=Mucilaginibacter sp. KACC 22773 TaxID=3025671 RepID=UPI002364FF9F|nr:TetR/AcrR family transcriptional regulator [Mucilaginibacter sp. KACC 22773]WDF79021.1 TetR/AcrR family transcriptional regulator [Mucilaginibacter sp. KACC 22773]
MGKSEQKRQLIVSRAAVLFNEKGIAGTSVDDIIEATGTSKGCFYGHFESKEALSFASVDYLLEKLTERRHTALNKHTKAFDRICSFMEMIKNPLKSYFDGGCPIINLSTESDDTSPVIKKKMKKMINGAISEFTEVLSSGIATGEFSASLDANEFATKMFLGIEGANAICRVLGTAAPMHTLTSSLRKELAGHLNG